MFRNRGVALAMTVFIVGALARMAPVTTPAPVPISIVIDCHGRPELTTIRNTSPTPITLQALGSLYKPYDGIEPFALNLTLAAGESVTFQTGPGASEPGKLYGRPIYNDDEATAEGVRLETSAGTFTRMCNGPEAAIASPAMAAASPAMAAPARSYPPATPITAGTPPITDQPPQRRPDAHDPAARRATRRVSCSGPGRTPSARRSAAESS